MIRLIYLYITSSIKTIQGQTRSLDMEADDVDNNDNAESQDSHYKRANPSDTTLIKARRRSIDRIYR
jgi:hypothetical protein